MPFDGIHRQPERHWPLWGPKTCRRCLAIAALSAVIGGVWIILGLRLLAAAGEGR